MRLFLLPISSKHTLIYAQRLNKQLSTNQGYVERATAWASKKWVKWEASDGRVQKKVTTWGNSAFARIPYQEWGLKSIPPLSARRKKEELLGNEAVDAIYPSSIVKPADAPLILRRIATERQALHKKWMWWSLVGIPFTAPFMLIPVIPNLPFFYLVFRAWSHWRALSGSKHIQFLDEKGLIKYLESSSLAKAYTPDTLPKADLQRLEKSVAQSVTAEQKTTRFLKALESRKPSDFVNSETKDNRDRLIASKGTAKLASICLSLPQVNVEMERAFAQVSKALTQEARQKEQ